MNVAGRRLWRSWALALVTLGGVWLSLGASTAHAIPFNLDQDGCTGGCGTGSTVFGTVNVVQGIDANHVNITVTLNPTSGFIATGAGESLEFNITGNPAITITNLTAGFVVGPAPASASTFGSFNYSVDCGGAQPGHCGPGASVILPGPLSFTVEKTVLGALSPTDFVANGGGFFFASDIIGPTSNTGNVASRGPSGGRVPAPASLLLLGVGLSALAAWGRRGRARQPHST